MNGFQIGTIVLGGLVLLVAWMHFREVKTHNQFIQDKMSCSCKDHGSPSDDGGNYVPDNAPISNTIMV